MLNPIGALFTGIAQLLARFDLIDGRRGERIADLTWPRTLTMFARHSQRVADVAMVGLTIGPTAIAGLAFATVYWGLCNGISLGVAGGTITQVSQRHGADRLGSLEVAVKGSAILGAVLVIPFVLVYWLFADPLIALLGNDPASIEHGATYLEWIAVGLVFNVLNLVASRALAGADDTWIAMTVRATGAAANIVFNAIFIFGLGMGVAGAALGTVLAEALVTACFAWGFFRGGLPVVGEFPIRLSLGRPWADGRLTRELLEITPPIMGRKLSRSVVGFPLFAMLAAFGPAVVAAFEVGRRIQRLMSASGAGFSMSSSSLVGQALGRGEETEANAMGWDVLRFSMVVYALLAVAVFVFADPLSYLFNEDPEARRITVPFIRVAAISFLGMGADYTFEGILKAAGDNNWPMYGQLFGQYVALLSLTYVGLTTPLGVFAVYLAVIAESWSSALIAGQRFFSGVWLRVSRAYRPTADD